LIPGSLSDLDPSQPELKASTFDVIQRRKRISLSQAKHVVGAQALLQQQGDFQGPGRAHNKAKFRFEFKIFGERNKAPKILDRAGFDYELVEDLRLSW